MKKLLKGGKVFVFASFFFQLWNTDEWSAGQLKVSSRVRQHVVTDLAKQLDTLGQEALNGGE